MRTRLIWQLIIEAWIARLLTDLYPLIQHVASFSPDASRPLKLEASPLNPDRSILDIGDHRANSLIHDLILHIVSSRYAVRLRPTLAHQRCVPSIGKLACSRHFLLMHTLHLLTHLA